MRVEVVLALRRAFRSMLVELPEGAVVADAVAATPWGRLPEVAGYARHGQRVEPSTPLTDGDRVELLRPLQLDPKQARRRRAAAAKG